MDTWIFPGQGSQFVGMGSHLSSDAAHETFAIARDVLGWDVRSVQDSSLDATEISQPAILTVSVAAARTLETSGSFPDAVAGHSVGEFAALVAGHAISFEDALEAIATRARAMAHAGRERHGGMAAILGLSFDDAERACREIDGIVVVATINAPTQIVISGDRDAVAAAGVAARDLGARRVVPLDVSVAAHSPLMKPATDQLRRALVNMSVFPPTVPFVSCISGRREDDPAEISDLLCRALTRPVRWVETVRALGADRFLEVGPGRVLCGLVRSIVPGAEAVPVGDDDTINSLTRELTGQRAR